ncbi:S9 family peptidase [Thalassotalea ponticola]|uniref:alpha/beta hydrolase family protein n=1 Tax=Thalassotalea ponticola TaxID=1523392 RepID=UPI0025B2E172|nr:S9 family peptidase [Thalassotalea ponticola]MDN3652142.1 S9 family peptidase [Thalassotalea ponticola]
MKLLQRIFAILISLSVTSVQAIELHDFARDIENDLIRISPNGKHIAIRSVNEGKRNLVFVDTKTKKVTYAVNMSGEESIGYFDWVNDERVVISINSFYGPLDLTYSTGRLFAVNYDGSQPESIFGATAAVTETSSIRGRTGSKVSAGHAYIASLYKQDPRKIIISVSPWQNARHKEAANAEIYLLDVYTGKQRKLLRSPGRGNDILLDHNGEVRFAQGVNVDRTQDLFYRDVDGEWQSFDVGLDTSDGDIDPQGFSADNDKVYFIYYNSGDTGTLYSYQFSTQKLHKIYHNEYVEISDVLTNYKNQPYGIRIDEDYSNYLIFNDKVEHANVHKNLYAAFKGDSVEITSATEDGKILTVYVSGDRNPGTYYLYNTETNKAQFLTHRASWLDQKKLARVEPFHFTSRDGLKLTGYLTLPNGKKDANLPLIVHPHGGPHGPRDYWEYDWRTQAIASQGYAILQVNFRGSGGYGATFEQAGYQEWGRKIQHDIIDATKWAIASKVADKNRICIWGGSFGAYSAVQSAILAPDLYECVIGASGVYDLEMMFTDGDTPGHPYGRHYLNKVLGGIDHETIKPFSPVHNVDQLKAPILLIHGSADERTPISQAEALEKALRDKKHPYKTLYIDNEYHGFITPEHRVTTLQTMLDFIKEHIGS